MEMSRGEFFASLIAGGTTDPTTKRHHLSHYSDEEVWRAIQRAGAEAAVRNELNRVSRQKKRAAHRRKRIEAGQADIVAWRGVITEELPRHSQVREVADRRKRATLIACAKGGIWQGEQIPPDTRILVDARCPDDSLVGQRGEIMLAEGMRTKMRIHIWPGNRPQARMVSDMEAE